MPNSLSRRPQLAADEMHQLQWLLGGLLTLLGAGTVFYMDVDAWTLMVVTSAAALATLLWPTLPSRVPALVHTLAFPAIVTFFAADLWLKTEILPAMVRLDILLLLYRSLSYRQRRDDLQIIILGLFLIIVAGVLTVSLAFAAQILIYTACALAFLLVITLTEANAPGRKPSPVAPGEVPTWAVHANWGSLFRRLREVADWRVVALGAGLFAGVVGVSALLFLAIPRFQLENSMFLDRFISKKAKSGFSDVIRLNDVTEIQQDTNVALSVDVTDQTQIPATPYWRMLVLDQYENGTFKFSAALRRQAIGPERTAGFLHGEERPRRAPSVYWTFYLESGVSRYLPLLGQFEVLRFREPQNFRLAADLAVVQLREDPVTMTAYRVENFDASGVLHDPKFARRWREEKLPNQKPFARQVQLMVGDSDAATLARVVAEVAGDAKLDAADFGQRVNAWLKQNHAYSLSPNIPRGDGDPLVRWLTSQEAGHCELFAGSVVLLARRAGYPARVVTGFKGGTWNAYSNNFTIRNSDAHAWAEIFDEKEGAWLRTDPLGVSTATQNTEVTGAAALAGRMDRSWTARLDSLRVFWYRRIVSFDQRSQAETLKAMKEATEKSAQRIRAALASMVVALKGWFSAPWDGRRLARVLGMAGAIAVAGWIGRTFGRAWWQGIFRPRGRRQGDPVRREAGRWLGRMPGSRAATAAGAGVVAELQRLRFGARHTWPEPARVFRRARQVWREERRSQGRTRRVE